MDEDYAKWYLDNEPEDAEQSEYTPPLETWTPELSALADIKDILSAQTQTIVGMNGGKAKRIKPTARPKTAIDIEREKRSQQQQLNIINMFKPKT